MNTTALSKDQIKSLVLNAYGFMAKYNVLYYCQEDHVHDEMFELIDIDGDRIEFTYNNASICNGSVTFEDTTGDLRLFTILIVATDGSGLLPQLLKESK